MSFVLVHQPAARALRRVGFGVGSVGLMFALGSCSSSQPAAPTFDTVTRGDVSNGVTASGALAASGTEELGFQQGGKLTSVKVKVGQKVSEGDVLARIDSTSAKKTLAAAQGNLDAQAANLARTSDDPSIQSAAASLAQARVVVSRTRAQGEAVENSDSAAISRAKKQRSADEDARDDAEDAVDQLNDACDEAQGLAAQAQAAAQADPTNTAAATTAASAVASATSVCGQAGSAASGVTAAKQRVTGDTTAVVAAEQRRKVDCASSHLAVSSAEQGVVSARNAYNAAVKARPHALDQQGALLDAAQAQVDAAQKTVDDATLTAPSDGTVSAVNGTKGEYLSPSTGTTALAPGSKAAIPGASGAAGAAAAGAASPTRPGGSQFIVLSNVEKLQVVLPFEESDAAQVKAGQTVDISLDALPDLQVQGKVVSVSPTATPISGVVSYYATVGIDQRDPRMRDGQTARATVLTVQRSGVLTVPNNAVRQQGGQSTVVVYEPSGDQRTVTFEPGVAGTDRTEVVSGLNEGDRVVVPSHP